MSSSFFISSEASFLASTSMGAAFMFERSAGIPFKVHVGGRKLTSENASIAGSGVEGFEDSGFGHFKHQLYRKTIFMNCHG